MARKGQTMLEGMVAIFIIIVGVVGAMALAMGAFSTSGESSDQVKAVNFAREGLEVIRNIRDTNWVTKNNFDMGLVGASADIIYATLNFNPDLNGWGAPVFFNTNDGTFNPTENNCPQNCQLYLNNDNNVYNHDPSYQASGFYRLVKFNDICLYSIDTLIIKDDKEVCSMEFSERKIGTKVTVKVNWYEGNTLRSVEAVDRLFDWR
jgi:hypothetical protein